MDPSLSRLIKADTPELNPALAGGLATAQMKMSASYVDEVFRAVSKRFPKGLKYLGCKPCTPQEEFAIATRNRGVHRAMKKYTRKTYETARSDVYLMQYLFSYDDGSGAPPEVIDSVYIYLPFVGQAGSITMRGSNFNISPVLSDRVISIGPSSIFVRLLCDRLTFQRLSYAYMADSRRENIQMVHSLIHHKSGKAQKIKPTVRAVTSMAHYLFCKYGFTEAFRRFAKTTPVVVTSTGYDPNNYPDDQWVMCASTGVKPRGYGKGPNAKYYEASDLRILVRREDYTPLVKALVGGFFYVVDHFPQQMHVDWVDNTRQWMILMGHILFSGNTNAGKLFESVASHIDSLDGYIDDIAQAKMADIGIFIDEIYEFFAIIIERFNEWLLADSDKINSMYDKELTVLYYALFDITEAIFNFHFSVKAAAKKGLTAKEVKNIMTMTLKAQLICNLTKRHGEVSSNHLDPGSPIVYDSCASWQG